MRTKVEENLCYQHIGVVRDRHIRGYRLVLAHSVRTFVQYHEE